MSPAATKENPQDMSSEDKIITMIVDRLDRIEDSVNDVREKVNANVPCPAPGTCLTLAKNIVAAEGRVDRLEIRLQAIEKWQNKVIGIGSALVVSMTLFGPSIRKLLNLE